MNIATWVELNGKVHSDRPAVSHGAQTMLTYGQWASLTRSRAGALARRFRKGDRVAIAMNNSPAFFEAIFAIWHAGLVAVPVNSKLHRNELAYILENSGAVLAVTDEGLAQSCSGLCEILATGSGEWRKETAGDEIDLVPAEPDDPAWIFYTSGTTGRPKGATLTHRNLLMMSLSYYADIEQVTSSHAMIHPAPLSHGSGLYSLPFVAKGANNVVPESGAFDAQEIAALFRTLDGFSFFAAPTMIRRLLENPDFGSVDKRALRTLIYGGAPMHVEDLKRALDALGNRLAQIYGQGESPMTITALSKEAHAEHGHPRWLDRLGSAGVARTGVEVRVVDDEDRPLPLGETGEIICRGDVVMTGYWQNPAASAETLRGGWLHTGDVGAIDQDGFLALKDRSKDVIISGGSNIYPREIEEVLLRHAAVREVSVVGVPDPDWGEQVVAIVTASGPQTAIEAELDALCLSAIARFKRPKRYVFVDELPKNNYGKVLKTALREQLARRP